LARRYAKEEERQSPYPSHGSLGAADWVGKINRCRAASTNKAETIIASFTAFFVEAVRNRLKRRRGALFAFYHCYSIFRVACARERPQAHTRDRVPQADTEVDLRVRLEERKDRFAKTWPEPDEIERRPRRVETAEMWTNAGH
jgi:hypothetical protein